MSNVRKKPKAFRYTTIYGCDFRTPGSRPDKRQPLSMDFAVESFATAAHDRERSDTITEGLQA